MDSFFQKTSHHHEQVSQNNEEENQLSPRTKNIIQTLPKRDGWTSLYPFYQYQGFWYILPLLKGTLKAQQQFNPKPNDIIITSFMKTGTTWLKALIFSITTRHIFNDSTNPLLFKLPHDCLPFMEFDLAEDSNNRDMKYPDIPLVSTHVPYIALPEPIKSSGCKIVYICRDPKDVFVSSWHFFSHVLRVSFPIREAFDLFCEGVSFYGPYWDHVLGYWKASLESPDKVMFLKYEEMKKDTAFHVRKLADFAGVPFSSDENGVMEGIIEMCSFEKLSKLKVNQTGTYKENSSLPVENKKFFRKGEVGDWRHYLDDEMVERLNRISKEKLSEHGLETTY